MKKGFLTSMSFTAFLLLPACHSMDRMLGKDHKDNPGSTSPVQAPVPAQRIDIYRDGSSAVTTDSQTQMSQVGLSAPHYLQVINTLTDAGKTESVRTNHVELSPTAGEGTAFVRVHTDTDGSGSWIITFDKNGTGRTVDLSGRSAIVFMIRLRYEDRPLVSTDQIFMNVEDGNGVMAAVSLQSATGLNPNSFEWQTVRIPTSALGGLDLSKVRRPFGLTYGTLGNLTHLDIDFDDIRWEL